MNKRDERARESGAIGLGSSRDTLEVEIPQERRARRVHVLHVVDGAHAGLIHVIATDEVTIGRAETCELPLGDAGISRAHVRLSFSILGVQVADLASRNGTFVNGLRLTEQTLLRQGDTIMLGGVRLRYSVEAEEQVKRLRDLHDAAVRDHLTGLYNRRFFDERLTAEVAYAVRHSAPLSLIVFDIDRFKQINDTHGHAAGDVALKAVAAVLTRGVRTEDLVARYGGEEFTVLARGSGIDGAMALAERLRDRVQNLRLTHEGATLRVQVSGGAAALSGKVTNARKLLRAADGALFDAKEQGRNRVLAASFEDPIERTGEMEAVPAPKRKMDGTD